MKRAWGESLCGMVFGRLSVVVEAERKGRLSNITIRPVGLPVNQQELFQ